MVSFLALFWLYFGSNNFDWHKYENKFLIIRIINTVKSSGNHSV